MSSPFGLLGMAHRATANLRQMSYGSTAPAAAPATSSLTFDDNNSDTVSISSATKRRSFSPLLQTRKPSLAVVDNVNATSSPATYPPATAEAVLSDVVSNGSSTMLVMHEPTSGSDTSSVMLSESPWMEAVELNKSVDSIDYFSLPPRESSEESAASTLVNLGDCSALEAVIEELKLAKKGLEDQVQRLSDEKQRVADDLESLTHESQRSECELKEKQGRWDEEKAVLIAEQDRERSRFEQEKSSFAGQVRDLMDEKEGLIKEFARKQEQWDEESAQVAEKTVREIDILDKEKQELEGRVTALESRVNDKEQAEEKLEDILAVLKTEQEDNARTMIVQQQYLVTARNELESFQFQAAKEIQAATAESRRLSQQLKSEKEATKKLQESADARVNSLQNDIDSMRDDRERQIASRDNQINLLNAKLDKAKNAPIKVTFNVRAETVCGENIFITGSIDQLKHWSPKNAIALSPHNYPIWSVTLSIPASTAFEYKYIRKFNGALTSWESDPNCWYSSPASGIATINDIWR
ncbi:hypothetical protein EST38_g9161 [Candolleomyces aberdarensis]|uniref:CBM20 domain-containing protein n=1 Tax=Candolleomyces aberdarensis TaxID=2316362 RepID=A0A4Q2DAS8_9AGAR|nr:hypothetical protein EST38_g9161 [Candolleomyces aberdarensis]